MTPPPLLGGGRRRGLALIAALALVQAAAIGAAAFAVRSLFAGLGEAGGPPIAPLVILIASGFVIAAARVAFRMAGERMAQGYAREVREALFRHAAQMAPEAVAARRAGYMTLRMVGDLTAFRNWLASGLPNLIAATVILPATIAVLWALEPAFGLAAAALTGGALLAIRAGAGFLVGRHARLRAARARLAADMTERMPAAPELAWLGRLGVELRLIRRRSREVADLAVARIGLSEGLRSSADILSALLAAAVIGLGAAQGAGAGEIAAALAAGGLGAAAIRDLSGVANHHAAYLAAYAKCAAALARPTLTRRRNGGRALGAGPQSLEIHARGAPVLTAEPGARLLIRAEKGCALDGLVSLVRGQPSDLEMRARIGGKSVAKLGARDLRRAVALVSPRPLILKGSLRRALTMGRGDRLPDAAVTLEARRWGLGPLIEARGGLDGGVGEGGRDLDEAALLGVAFTRAALSGAGIWLIDRAARSLTPEAAAALGDARATMLFLETAAPPPAIGGLCARTVEI